MKKYEFTDEIKEVNGVMLRRIRAVRDFGIVCTGELGGWVESRGNLPDHGECWVDDEAMVFGAAKIDDDAVVGGDVIVCGEAMICGDALVEEDRDYIVFKNWWSSGRYFTWTRSNDKYKVGCFYGSGEELIKKAYADSEECGREYERIVRYVESIKNE